MTILEYVVLIMLIISWFELHMCTGVLLCFMTGGSRGGRGGRYNSAPGDRHMGGFGRPSHSKTHDDLEESHSKRCVFYSYL